MVPCLTHIEKNTYAAYIRGRLPDWEVSRNKKKTKEEKWIYQIRVKPNDNIGREDRKAQPTASGLDM